jgi:cellulose synthase/poly-beta-1,6-N-acetylglucosamine synthase-like glycosyltransferase
VDYCECEIDLSLEQPPLGANMAFRREVFEKIGGFNPELGRIGAKLLGGEETDLFKRLAESGCSGKYQPKAVVNHVLEPERLRKAYFRKVYFHGGQSRGLLFSPGPGRRFIGVPLFSVRQLLQKGLAYLSAAISDEPSESFVKELHAWWLLGFMAGCSQNRQRPHA